MKRYGYHQDPRGFGRYATIYLPLCLLTMCNYIQEGNQETYYPMYEYHICKCGSKSILILQVLQDVEIE